MYGAILGGLIIGLLHETFTAAYITSSYKRFYCFLPAYPGYDFHAQRNLQAQRFMIDSSEARRMIKMKINIKDIPVSIWFLAAHLPALAFIM